jgi:hypothetical protein
MIKKKVYLMVKKTKILMKRDYILQTKLTTIIIKISLQNRMPLPRIQIITKTKTKTLIINSIKITIIIHLDSHFATKISSKANF